MGVDLASLAPPFLQEIRELTELWKTQGCEVDALQEEIIDLQDQAFLSTATWGLSLWEDMYGITASAELSDERRRETLLAKGRGQGTTTKEMIRTAAESFAGGEVEVIEDNRNHCFVVKFVGVKGIPVNMDTFVNMLEDIKPAHLAYTFQYRYTVWGALTKLIWRDAQLHTWAEIRIVEEL